MRCVRLVAIVVCGGAFVTPSLAMGQVEVGPQQFPVQMTIDNTPDTTPPSVPTGVSATEISAVPQITVSWNASTDDQVLGFYNIYRDNTLYASTSLTSYADTGIFFDVEYAYEVSAVDLTGNESARSATVTAEVTPSGGSSGPFDDDPPTVPENLGATIDFSGPEVTLTWDPSSDADSGLDRYRVFRDGTFRGSVTSGETFVDTTVALDTAYVYTVSAVDRADNESAESDPLLVDVTPPDTTPPTTPTGLSVDAIDEDVPEVVLSWDTATDTQSGVASYRLYRDGGVIATTTAPVTSFTDTTVATETSYTYRVSALDGAGNESTLSSAVVADVPGTADVTPPTTPTGLARTINGTAPSVSLTWSAATDADSGVASYQLLRDGVPIATTTGTSYLDASVAFSTTYTYRVRAVDGAGNTSSSSAPVSAAIPAAPPPPDTTPPSVPTGLAGTPDADDPSVALSWDP
ncbi:hypothetical protein GVX82_02965, partial [Patescibacteria group bacterium]|nr:hypothetical protein [Patescibacteria group bacterium]